jgi:predicted DNA-binding protein
LKDHASLTDAEQAFYIRESVTQFLNEFAGNLPYSSISYLKRADGLYYGTIKANELYKKTAQMTKDGSREWAEYEGFLRLEEILEKTDAAIEVSPPLVADYGFVFFPKSTGQMVRMNVIRYPEKMHAVSKSREFQEVVTGVPCDYIHAHHFITQPVAVDSNILPQLLQTAGVSQEDIARAQEFERRVGLELSDSMNRYYAKLSACNGAVTAEKKTELEKLIADMYLRAREIREEIHYERQQGFQYSQINALQVNQHSPDHVMQSRSLLVPGGGSCPTVRRNGFLSQSDISEALSMNIPLEQKLRLNELSESNKDSGYDCPDCGKHYTDETHLPHEKRTKECTCGFKFGC